MPQRQPIARLTIDATPLLGQRTGIGTFVQHLVAGLAGRTDVNTSATAFTLRGHHQLAAALPAGVAARGWPVPARALRVAWRRLSFPWLELIAGQADVFHATNYVLPPLRHARGVLSVHDLSYLHLPHTVHAASMSYRELVPMGLRRAAVACALTAWTADEIADTYAFPRERIVVTPLGVDDRWFAPAAVGPVLRADLALPPQYLVFVGTREPRKGLPLLIRAHAALGDDAPPLLLVGASGWGDQATFGAGVITLPYLDAAHLPSIVAGAAALVMPSLYEGFGIPVLEGMAAGIPVVISDTPAMLEVAGGHASTFPVGEAEALAEVLRRVLAGEHPDLAAGTVHARSWTWDRCVDACVSAYRAALA
ncbi:MAG: glycosyltransferase family 4 protein [Actinomycetota bacterium]|nr:glycosyltransferase family 4 protein [Actinomycetota bacterium]